MLIVFVWPKTNISSTRYRINRNTQTLPSNVRQYDIVRDNQFPDQGGLIFMLAFEKNGSWLVASPSSKNAIIIESKLIENLVNLVIPDSNYEMCFDDEIKSIYIFSIEFEYEFPLKT